MHEPKGKADFHVLQSCQDLLFMPREVCTAAFLEAPPIHLDQRAPSSRHSPQIAYRPSKWRELKNYIKLTLKTHTNGIFSSTESLSHVRLCSRMDCSTPCLPVHHQLLELAQTHVDRVGDAIQPSHPLSSPSSPAFHLSQHPVFSFESVLNIRWPKYGNFSFSISPSSEYSGLISFRMDWLDLLAV